MGCCASSDNTNAQETTPLRSDKTDSADRPRLKTATRNAYDDNPLANRAAPVVVIDNTSKNRDPLTNKEVPVPVPTEAERQRQVEEAERQRREEEKKRKS